ncbi:MAG TPA: hypothetical protein VF760_02090 [Xanthobacteraceae bacterium]
MSEHYPKSTSEVPKYCPRCRRITQHRVSAGRVTHCLEHLPNMLTKKQAERRARLNKAQGELFKEFS